MPGANPQATTVMENPYSERPRPNDDARGLLATGAAAGYPVHFSSGSESEAWPQDAQDDWIPGFGAMVSSASRPDNDDLKRNFARCKGSANAARCVESVPPDSQDHL